MSDILDLIFKVQISHFVDASFTTIPSFNILINRHEYSQTISVLTKDGVKLTEPTSVPQVLSEGPQELCCLLHHLQ